MRELKYPYLNNIIRAIWELYIKVKRTIWVFAEYVASKENSTGKEYRLSYIDTERKIAY
jgi:hypothetical protein